MKSAAEAMVQLALSLAEGKPPAKGSYLPSGVRQLIVMPNSGAARAADMLAAKLSGQEVETELPLPTFEKVDPAPPLKDISQSTIVLATEGGLIPRGNPDHIEVSMATRYGCYSIEGMSALDPESFTVGHGGYDNGAAQANPNRLLPLDVMREIEQAGEIGRLAEVFYTTAGNATSVENAARFGREIALDIRKRFGQNVGVVFTST
jgi:glycine reductase